MTGGAFARPPDDGPAIVIGEVDPTGLLLGLAGVTGAVAAALLGAGWFRHRRGSGREDGRELPPRRVHVRRDVEDPVLASLELPDARHGGRKR